MAIVNKKYAISDLVCLCQLIVGLGVDWAYVERG